MRKFIGITSLLVLFQTMLTNYVFGGNNLSSGSAAVQQAFVGAPKKANVKLLSTPPKISAEQIRLREEYLKSMRHIPYGVGDGVQAEVPVNDSLFLDESTATFPANENMESGNNPPTGAAADFVYFESTDLGESGAPSGQRSYVNEPSVANNGRCMFYSGNWYASLSIDGGKTFQYINPYTAFPPPAEMSFCCDQVVLYDPGRDCLFWLLQYTSDSHTNNIERLAVANNFSNIENQQWYYFDFTPQQAGAQDGSWYDFPDLSLSKNSLYLTANIIGPDNYAAISRISLDALTNAAGFGYGVIKASWPKWTFRAVQGATASTTMYWAAHNSTNSIRIYNWNEGAGTYRWNDVTIEGWYNAARTSTGADGKRWLNHFPSTGGYILGAWMAKGKLGFMWCSSQGGSHSEPYVRVAMFDQQTRAHYKDADIWSHNDTFAFPSVNVNGRGDIAGTVVHCSSASYPSVYNFIWDDYSVIPPGWEVHAAITGTSGPKSDRFGDYFSTRVCWPYTNTWLSAVYALQGGDQNSNAVPRFLWFGRERDLPFYELQDKTPVTFTEIPKDFSFQVKSYDWCGIAINPTTADHDIETDDDFRFQNIYQRSNSLGSKRDFIVTDGRDFGSVTLYAKVYWSVSNTYVIEADWFANDLSIAHTENDSMGSDNIIRMYEVNVTSGEEYDVTLDVTNGTIDVSMFGFDASKDSGNRNSADWSVDHSGAGGDEITNFVAKSSGLTAIAVINENANAGGYTILVELIPEPVLFTGFFIFFILYYSKIRK